MKKDNWFEIQQMLRLQLREEEQECNKMLADKKHLRELKEISQRINSIKRFLNSLDEAEDLPQSSQRSDNQSL